MNAKPRFCWSAKIRSLHPKGWALKVLKACVLVGSCYFYFHHPRNFLFLLEYITVSIFLHSFFFFAHSQPGFVGSFCFISFSGRSKTIHYTLFSRFYFILYQIRYLFAHCFSGCPPPRHSILPTRRPSHVPFSFLCFRKLNCVHLVYSVCLFYMSV